MAEYQEKIKKPIYKKWWFWLIVIVIIVAIASSSSSNNDSDSSKTTLTSGDTTADNNNSQTEAKSSYNVGEIYEDKSIAIKYVSLDDNFTGYNKYAEVKNGYKIIKAEFEFENVGTSDILASAYDFNCYADGYDCDSFWSVDDSAFSSSLSSGKKTKGAVYFQVPVEAAEITLEYETNVWTSNKVVFNVK